ncbi:MAG: GNAT family N-acetyltransferase [Actinobacteria bacterium]|nr:GNAT family N-acetyltransferase [Actinomycetota bacterium]
MAPGDLTGILLVGGASRRFGSPKALAELDGETLAARAWRTLGKVCSERLALGKRQDGLELPFDVVDDESQVRAPLAGLVVGLRAATNDLCIVLPVDVPLIRAADIRMLATACADAAVPQTGPLPGAYRRSALPVLERRLASGELALRDALTELDATVVDLDASALVNVNEPSELERLQTRIVPFDPAHATGFRSLVSETLREFGFEPDPEIDPDLADPARAYRSLWVAVADGEVVGSVALRNLGAGERELKRMYLRSDQRGRGLGRRPLETALAHARADGAALIRLDTSERMEAARSLYEAYGFRRVSGSAPRQGQNRLLCELEL